MLYNKYVESRLFISSLRAMHSFCREAVSTQLADERDPLRTAYLVAFTCSRTFDSRPLDRLACVAGEALLARRDSLSWWDSFRIDYVMVAAKLDDPAILARYLDRSGHDGTMAGVRVASLAYFLGRPQLLAQAVERMLSDQRPQFVWEALNGQALYALATGSMPDLPALCKGLKEAEPEFLPYFALDLNLLLLEMQPSLRPSFVN